ncbi:RNA-binding protein [Mycobacterium sp. pW049]|uniref:RNA-binding protein n=1 Tax=[Mycobacterium] bulgaricum TaxID=3238985 RepID=UPI00351B11C2
MHKSWLGVAVMAFAGASLTVVPVGSAAVCGSVGGVHVDVTGCADPLSELNDVLDYPPPPPPPPPPPGSPTSAPPPPPPPPPPPVYVPPAPNVSVCADVGRRINVSGCI